MADKIFPTGFADGAATRLWGDDGAQSVNQVVGATGRAVLESATAAAARGTLAVADSLKIRLATDVGATLDVATHVLGAVGQACTIAAFDIVASASGSTVLDVLVNGSSICAAAKPTLAAATQAINQPPTGWTVALAAGDLLSVEVESSDQQIVCLTLRVVKG